MVLTGTPEEFAALAVAIQERQVVESFEPVDVIRRAVQQAIDGIAEASQDSSPSSSDIEKGTVPE